MIVGTSPVKAGAAVVLAFATPWALYKGWGWFESRVMGWPAWGMGTIDFVLAELAPFLGFVFIAQARRRWDKLTDGDKALYLGTTILYWLVYVPFMFGAFLLYLLGRSGGI